MSTHHLTPILDALQQAQQIGDYGRASALLAKQIETLLDACGPATVIDLLAGFPPALCYENRDLCYIEGIVYARTGRVQEAIKRLERARFSYTVAGSQVEQAVHCSLELARLYCSREHFQTAYYHLRDHVQPWIDQGLITDSALRARFYLRMAEITPDIGRFCATVDYARQALAIYQQTNDLPGQYFTLVRIAAALIHLANYGEAVNIITLAKECLAVGEFGPLAHARVLNLECHYHWQRGQLAEALVVAHRYLALVDQDPASNFRVYARILLGNLHRDLGHFATAKEWYAETRQVTAELDYHLYLPWIDAQEAWLHVLQGRPDQARLHIHASLQTADLGQAMSFQVALAVIYLLDGQPAVAQWLFSESLAFYIQSGDELAVCILHFYLTLTAQRQGQTATAYTHLDQALGWLAQRHIDYVPYWWHPQIMSEVCAHALAVDLYPDVVEHIFINHLGQQGAPALRALLQAAAIDVRRKAYRLLRVLNGQLDDVLAHLPDGAGKQVLAALLANDQLRPEGFVHLERELMTATRRQKPNLTLLAVFGLYVNGVSRAEIAERLGCSLPNVRNYITMIYQHFGLADEAFADRRVRRQRLVAVARERGFVD